MLARQGSSGVVLRPPSSDDVVRASGPFGQDGCLELGGEPGEHVVLADEYAERGRGLT